MAVDFRKLWLRLQQTQHVVPREPVVAPKAIVDGYLKLQVGQHGVIWPTITEQEGYSMKHLEHFLESFAHGIGATINIMIENPDEDLHTNIETVFKSLGLALDMATQIDPRRKNAVPSTKGIID